MRKGKPAKPRNRKRLVLFAAEGRNRTESLYMRDLARDCASVTLHRSRDASTDPVGMVSGLVEAMGYYGFSAEHGDLAFCLVDFDLSHDKERQVRDALRIAEAHGIRLIISNPCFELWYICHFTANPQALWFKQRPCQGYGEIYPILWQIHGRDIWDPQGAAAGCHKECGEPGAPCHRAWIWQVYLIIRSGNRCPPYPGFHAGMHIFWPALNSRMVSSGRRLPWK